MNITNEKGLTFIELMIVMVIIAMGAIASSTFLLSWSPNLRLKTTANDIYGVLQRAKLEAIKRNACVGMNFTTNGAIPADPSVEGGSYTTFIDNSAGGSCNGTQDAGEQTLTTANVDRDVSLYAINGNLICFTPTSVSCGSQPGNVQLSNVNTSRYYQISVSAAGVVQNRRNTDGGTTWIK